MAAYQFTTDGSAKALKELINLPFAGQFAHGYQSKFVMYACHCHFDAKLAEVDNTSPSFENDLFTIYTKRKICETVFAKMHRNQHKDLNTYLSLLPTMDRQYADMQFFALMASAHFEKFLKALDSFRIDELRPQILNFCEVSYDNEAMGSRKNGNYFQIINEIMVIGARLLRKLQKTITITRVEACRTYNPNMIRRIQCNNSGERIVFDFNIANSHSSDRHTKRPRVK